MTSQPSVSQLLRPLRDIAAWVLVGVPAVLIFVSILDLIPFGDGDTFLTRTQGSFYDFVNLATILLPLAAVLLALLVEPRHPKAQLITMIALGEYAAAAFFGLIFGFLIGLVRIAGFSVQSALQELLARAAWLALLALAGWAAYSVWRGLFYVAKPKPQPGVYGQPAYGVPGTYPGQPGYGQPPAAYHPGQPTQPQPGAPGYPPPPPGAPAYGPGAPTPAFGPGAPAPAYGPGAPGYGASGAPTSAVPASGAPTSGPATPGAGQQPSWNQQAPLYGQPPLAQQPSAAYGTPPTSGAPTYGTPPSSGAPAYGVPPTSGAPSFPPLTPPSTTTPAFSEPTVAVPRPGQPGSPVNPGASDPAPAPGEDDRTQVVGNERPGFGPADQDPPRA